MSDRATDHHHLVTAKRARSYLRWYPPLWRERYGAEFTAHMESELLERPSDPSRTLNIILHGVLTRVSLQRRVRRTIETVFAAAITTTVVVAIVAAQHVAPALALSNYTGGGVGGGVGIPTTSSQVTDLGFTFSSKTRSSIRITSITLEGIRGLKTPSVVGVDLERRPSDLANMSGWPIVPDKGSLVTAKELEPALNRTVTLAHANTLWIGLRASKVGTAYVINGLLVTYVHRGSTHTVVLDRTSNTDELCVVPKEAPLSLQPCARELALAAGEAFYDHRALSPSPSVRVALAVGAAASYFAFYNHRAATLRDVRSWAIKLFPVHSKRGVLNVKVLNDHQHLWSFEIRGAAKSRSVRVCTTSGVYTTVRSYAKGESLAPPTKAVCPGPTSS